jgi:hypothetical protein
MTRLIDEAKKELEFIDNNLMPKSKKLDMPRIYGRWFMKYRNELDLITNAPTVQREGWVSLTDMQITNIAMQHQSLHQVAKAIDNELRAINNV